MLPRRGFLAIVAGALGAAFLPKSKAKPIPPFLGFVDAGTTVYKAQDEHLGEQLSYITRRSSMARITSGSSVVVCDEVLDISPGQYLVGRGIPVGSQVVTVVSPKVVGLDKKAWASKHTMIAVHPDEGSALLDLRMSEAGQAVREMMANSLFRT